MGIYAGNYLRNAYDLCDNPCMANREPLHPDADLSVSHHEDCDGLRFHAMQVIRDSGSRRGVCSSCTYTTGLADSDATLRAMWEGRAAHVNAHPAHDGLCHGECGEWT